jgi:hypothetical protein
MKAFSEDMPIKRGELFQFCYINSHTRDINSKSGIFLGERTRERSDGNVIYEFAVQLFGESTERILDGNLRRWMIPLEAK